MPSVTLTRSPDRPRQAQLSIRMVIEAGGKNGVIAPDTQRYDVVTQYLAIGFADAPDAVRQVKRINCYIAQICDLEAFEWSRAGCQIKRAKQARLRSNLPRPEARAWAIGSRDVQRNPDKTSFDAGSGGRGRQSHHRRLSGEPGHRVAA